MSNFGKVNVIIRKICILLANIDQLKYILDLLDMVIGETYNPSTGQV